MNKYLKSLTLIFMFQIAYVYPQAIGYHYIKNYNFTEIEFLFQPTSIVQDKNGLMLFGGKNGISIFDGQKWQFLELPNHMPVNAMFKSQNGIVYIASDKDFGYLDVNKKGHLFYVSLLPKLSITYDSLGIFNNIVSLNSSILFCSSSLIVKFDGTKCDIIKSNETYNQVFTLAGRVYVLVSQNKLYEIVQNKLIDLKVSGKPFPSELLNLVSISPEQTIAFDKNLGCLQYKSNNFNLLKSTISSNIKDKKVNCVLKTQNKTIAIGLQNDGLLYFDKNGENLEHFNKKSGLSGESINYIFEDTGGNLWISHEMGVSYIEVNSPFQYFSLPYQNSVTTSILFDKKLYLGTPSGIFLQDWPFKKKENGEPQKWTSIEKLNNVNISGLFLIDNKLYATSNKGLWCIKNETAILIKLGNYFNSFLELKKHANLILISNQKGLSLFRKSDDGLVFESETKGLIFAPSEMIESANGSIWLSNPDYKILKVKYNVEKNYFYDLKQYGRSNGLSLDIYNHIFNVNNRMRIVSVKGGIFEYNENQDSFVTCFDFDNLTGRYPKIKTIIEDKNQNIWYVDQDCAHVLFKLDNGWYKHGGKPLGALRNAMVKEKELIYPINEHVLFGTINGFAIYDSLFLKSYRNNFRAMIRKVSTIGIKDSSIYESEVVYDDFKIKCPSSKDNFVFDAVNNSFRFEVAAPFFESTDKIKFSYFLEGHDTQWSNWEPGTRREYTKLSSGKYIFHVLAKNAFERESQEDIFIFNIKAPFYQTWLANLIYALIFICIIYFIISIYIKNLKAKTNKSFNILKNDQIILERKLDNIEKHKQTDDLGLLIHFLIKKNSILIHIRHKLQAISSENWSSVKHELPIIIGDLETHSDTDIDWSLMEERFEKIYGSYLKNLKTAFPELVFSELKLCALIKMDLNNKDIACLMNTSTRGVDGYRYRIRKKLNLKREANLNEYLQKM